MLHEVPRVAGRSQDKVVLYGHTLRVCLLAGECSCRRGCSSPCYVRRVASAYGVKPGGDPHLLVSVGGDGGGVILGGDEVQQGTWSVKGCRAAVPRSFCLTGGTSVSRALRLGMHQGAWCRWTGRVACLWPLGASRRMVGGVQPSADGVGSSCFMLPSYGVSCSLERGRGCL